MGPTILDGERLIAFRHAYGINLDFLEKDVITVPLVDPERFDIIAFHHPDIGLAISRIIGLPGETIEVREGYVYINGSETPLDEPFIDEGSQWGKRTDIRSQRGDGIYEVPESSYFVMGDYRINSNDSRFWKTNHYLTYDQIIGKVVFRYWPTNMIKWLGSGV